MTGASGAAGMNRPTSIGLSHHQPKYLARALRRMLPWSVAARAGSKLVQWSDFSSHKDCPRPVLFLCQSHGLSPMFICTLHAGQHPHDPVKCDGRLMAIEFYRPKVKPRDEG